MERTLDQVEKQKPSTRGARKRSHAPRLPPPLSQEACMKGSLGMAEGLYANGERSLEFTKAYSMQGCAFKYKYKQP
jgi:hypothetical protein